VLLGKAQLKARGQFQMPNLLSSLGLIAHVVQVCTPAATMAIWSNSSGASSTGFARWALWATPPQPLNRKRAAAWDHRNGRAKLSS
jgi:hypothetical protein